MPSRPLRESFPSNPYKVFLPLFPIKTLSKELPPQITINNVLPGFTDTERLTELKKTLSKQKGISQEEVESAWLSTVPEGRLADPSELGQVVAFLCSSAASFIRGTSIPVDGGRTGSI